MLPQRLSLGQVLFVHVAIPPCLTRLVRLQHRVTGRSEVLRGVRVLGVVAAADVPAYQADAQIYPSVPHRQACVA